MLRLLKIQIFYRIRVFVLEHSEMARWLGLRASANNAYLPYGTRTHWNKGLGLLLRKRDTVSVGLRDVKSCPCKNYAITTQTAPKESATAVKSKLVGQ